MTNAETEQMSNVPLADQECGNTENPAGRVVDLQDIYTETVRNDFETQQPDQLSDDLTLENESESSVTAEPNLPTSSRTMQ